MKSETIFRNAEIMIPQNVDLSLWSVIACDQFTSDIDYWKSVEKLVANSPSTLDYILPEAYLGSEKEAETKKRIKEKMKAVNVSDYDIFDGFVYVVRTLPDGSVREGVVGAIDLEEYDYSPDSNSKIRATEETVQSRIPARVEIRKSADYELPHIMVFVPSECKIIDEAGLLVSGDDPLYDFELMMGGGHVKGYKITGNEADSLLKRIAAYEQSGRDVLYAIGDGNHSLAAAKARYSELKEEIGDIALSHPLRYALCEIINIGSDSIFFEPIYRIVTNCDVYDLLKALDEETSGTGTQQITVITKDIRSEMNFTSPSSPLTVGSVQNFIDGYLNHFPKAQCDYIHGRKDLIKLSLKDGAVGFIFDGIDKEDLFEYVSRYGPYPRKTFSMGDARSKRYYLEMRKIKE
ncbi:MAG: DUF1015 domain-containing protein [Clostridia bacterium]|nr:DUF1015 domain-containing protein [Clostridia bacterium]